MTKSNSTQSFPHCKQIFDDAYASKYDSILVEHTSGKPMTKSEQATLLGDLLQYRMLVRKENCVFYPEGHPQHMTSIFDPFSITKVTKNGKLYIRLRRRRAEQFKILQEDFE